jgi:transcriptional repressor NrdR
MRCPQCSYDQTKVLESRLSLEGRSVRRRRSCLKCNYRFTTYEKEEELTFQVRKKDGTFEAYSRDKALRGIQVACQKRQVSPGEIENMLNTIERNLQDAGERVVPSDTIGDLIMEQLRQIDHVAYVRFASVYKDFKDPEEFVSALKGLSGDVRSTDQVQP